MVDLIITVGVMNQPDFPETLFDLDKAIAMYLENERKYLSQIDNAALVKATKIGIKVFETAPRNSDKLERLIAARKRDAERTNDTFRQEELLTEVSALEHLNEMVSLHEQGRA